MLKQFQHIQKIITSNIGETKDYGGSFPTIVGLCAIFMSFFLLLRFDLSTVYFILLLGIGSFFLIDGNNWLIAKRDMIFREMLSLNTFLQNSKHRLDDIEIICLKVEKISRTLLELIGNLRFTKLLYSRVISLEQSHIIQSELILLLDYLVDLRRDLQIRLAEQQESLEGAEAKLKRHIQGTPELHQVSELQRVRLDRQIEQFEELQRVLVKV